MLQHFSLAGRERHLQRGARRYLDEIEDRVDEPERCPRRDRSGLHPQRRLDQIGIESDDRLGQMTTVIFDDNVLKSDMNSFVCEGLRTGMARHRSVDTDQETDRLNDRSRTKQWRRVQPSHGQSFCPRTPGLSPSACLERQWFSGHVSGGRHGLVRDLVENLPGEGLQGHVVDS